MTESDLVQGCIAQNLACQRQLYDRYKTAMYTLAYRITGDFDDANSVLQDTFLAVFRQLPTFRQEATLGAWIKAILVRNAYKQTTKIKRLVAVENLPEDSSAINWNIGNMDAARLEQTILALPEGARAVFVLNEVEGYTHREIAEMLGISEGTSKSQLSYAKKRLREMLVIN
ncbi:MAG: RNA polymerase sigma factor [Runella slithyformis]|nr:MAG: RNA polymerase sigma factor [Runella slithyformis]